MSHLANRWQRPEILEAIFDELSDALFVYDNSLHIVGVNQAAQQLLGMPAEEMIGKHCQEIFRCTACESSCGMLHGLSETSSSGIGSIHLHLESGRERMAVIRTVQILDDTGALEGVVATVRDLTAEALPANIHMIAESPAMLELLNLVRQTAVSPAMSILIEGENGTGKDLIAKTLHYESLRRSQPFVAINCAAVPATLLESELFGYEKGAFTDARAQKLGLFELAHKGTLFLDEIGEIPHSVQSKLLRVLEDRCFRRLGGVRDIAIDTRVIAATNRNLKEAVNEGVFRQDLYYRLNVIQLTVPPLRDRPQDILPLARFFVEHYNHKFNQQIQGLSAGAEKLLLGHRWPGNVRELRNVIERAMILEDTAHIRPSSLPIEVLFAESYSAAAAGAKGNSFTAGVMSLTEQERRLVFEALEKTGGNQSQAARMLGISREQLRYKMKKFNLHY